MLILNLITYSLHCKMVSYSNEHQHTKCGAHCEIFSAHGHLTTSYVVYNMFAQNKSFSSNLKRAGRWKVLTRFSCPQVTLRFDQLSAGMHQANTLVDWPWCQSLLRMYTLAFTKALGARQFGEVSFPVSQLCLSVFREIIGQHQQ